MNSHEQLAKLLSKEVASNVTVLIKGSRAMGMESLVDALGVNALPVEQEGNE